MFPKEFGKYRNSSNVAQDRKERAARSREESRARAIRGGDGPGVNAALAGKPDPADVERWTTYLPTKPPVRS
jgi:hypothetical protein